MQRRNHAQMCGSIIGLHLLMSVLPILEDDRFPLPPLEACIDSFRLGSDLSLKLSIALDAAAGRRTNLDKCKFALIFGKPLQERLNCTEAFQDALGVVHAIYPYTEKLCFASKFQQ